MKPFEKMTAFNKANPESKEVYRKMQQWHLKNDNQNNIFCPTIELTGYSQRLLLEFGRSKDISQLSYVSYKYANELQVFGTWRNTLGVYRIDDDVIGDVMKSLIPNDTPVSIFERLPEWCVYYDLSNFGKSEDGVALQGFWALFDLMYINNRYERILKIMVDFGDAAADVAAIIELPIDNNKTVEQSINDLYKSDENIDPFIANAYAKADVAMLKVILSALLWLCAEEPDISNILGEPVNKDQLRLPKYRVNKKTGVFIPPDKPIIYDIGKRLGGEIRTFNERITGGDSRISSRKRPHIRRGHWHGVWAGVGQNKEFKIYWQPAIFVNAG